MTTTVSSRPTGSPAPSGLPARAASAGGLVRDSNLAPAGAKSRRVKLRWVVAAVVVVLAGGLAWAAAGWSRAARDAASVEKFTVTPRSFNVVLKEKGELKAAKSTDIICEVEGRSTIISLIPEGTAVKEGDLLVELASDEIEDRIRQEELKEANAITAYEAAKTELEIQRDKNASDIRKAELQIELKSLELEKYEKGDWVQKLKDAEIAIQQAEINLERRAEDFEAAEQLFKRNFITKTEYEEDSFKYQKAIWDLEKAAKAKEVLVTYTHVAELRQRESDVEEAVKECARTKKNADAEEIKKIRSEEGKEKELDLIQDQLAKLRTQKEKCRITAPTQGFVVYYSGGGRRFWSSGDQVKEGASVHERQILLSLPDTAEMMVVVRVHEAKTNKLRIGQPAVVEVEGLPGRRFTGKVTKIAVLADTQNRWLNPDLKEYETEITLDPTDVPLKPGVTAHTEMLVETVEDALAVPVQAVYSKGGRRYVFRADGRNALPLEVQLGAIGTEWAQITDGLSGGEQVLLAFSDEHKRLIPDLPEAERGKTRTWGARSATGKGMSARATAVSAVQRDTAHRAVAPGHQGRAGGSPTESMRPAAGKAVSTGPHGGGDHAGRAGTSPAKSMRPGDKVSRKVPATSSKSPKSPKRTHP